MALIWKTLRLAVDEFLNDKVLRLAAALSYYSVFSLAPLVLISLSIAGWFFGEEAAAGLLEGQLQSLMGVKAAAVVEEMMAHTQRDSDNLLASLAGLFILILGAGGVFGQLQDALNTVWGLAPRPNRGIKGMIHDRFLSFTMVLGVGFLLLTSLLLTTFLHATAETVFRFSPAHPAFWNALNALISFAVTAVLFAAIFKVLPDAKIAWRDVREGALATALLFTLGKSALGWYLGREATASSYGSAGSLVLLLLWVYYSSVILLFGAEFTQVHARLKGREIVPDEGAVRLRPGSRI